ncbi:MAG: bile acid:sodium symporter family protein [Planctomycetales bacterium]|nr:bile acid:sodium symporter family protein [Planctomycetales bacterium]
MLERFLLVWLCISSAIAYAWPKITEALPVPIQDVFVDGKPTLPYAICITMFSIGWLLPKTEVDALFKRWPTVFAGTCVQYVTMPLLAIAVTLIVPLTEDLRTGVIMVGCVPGAMASNVLTLLARGNVSYSVSLTTSATLLSPICVPLVLRLMFGAAFPISLIMKTFIMLSWTVVIPTVFGHMLGRRYPHTQSRVTPFAKNLASLVILWIIAVVVGLNRDRLSELTFSIVGCLLFLNIGGYISGFLAGRWIGIDERMRRALALEIGMQNAGLGTTLAASIFVNRPEVLIPTALYTFGCMLTGTMLARYWSVIPPGDEPATT